MSLNDYSNVVVSASGSPLKQVGFGTLGIAGVHSYTNFGLSHEIADASEITDAGGSSKDPLYLMAQRAFQQKPRPKTVKVLKLGTAFSQVTRLTPIAANSTAYSITIKTASHADVTVTYTSDSSATVDEICDGLQAAIEAATITGVTVTPSGGTATYIDVAITAGLMLFFSDWDRDLIHLEDRTPDPGIADDLDAIWAFDDDWYGLTIDECSSAIAQAAAAWAETHLVQFAAQTSDWMADTSGNTTDFASVVDALSYKRTVPIFSATDTGSYSTVAAFAERFPHDPDGPGYGGVIHAKTWTGVAGDDLSVSQKSTLKGKRYTIYIETAGLPKTVGGNSADGGWFDYTRYVDWFAIRLQEGLFALQVNNPVVPYDDVGLQMVRGVCEAMITRGLRNGGIAPTDADGNPPSVQMPTLADTTDANRANRVLPGILIQFRYAGAIQTADPVNVVVTL